MGKDLIRFSVAVPEGLLERFDEHVARRGMQANRSEAIRDLMREQMAEQDMDDPDTEVVGSITMVYDHHVVGLSGSLDEIQHDHMREIVSEGRREFAAHFGRKGLAPGAAHFVDGAMSAAVRTNHIVLFFHSHILHTSFHASFHIVLYLTIMSIAPPF